MKIKYFILTIIVLVTGSIVTGYNKSNINTDINNILRINPAMRNAKNAQSDNISDWQQFKVDASARINGNEVKIGKIKSEMTSTNKKLNADYTKEVVRLEGQNTELKNKLSEFKYEGKEKWEVFKQGFNHDLDAVGKSINELLTKRH